MSSEPFFPLLLGTFQHLLALSSRLTLHSSSRLLRSSSARFDSSLDSLLPVASSSLSRSEYRFTLSPAVRGLGPGRSVEATGRRGEPGLWDGHGTMAGAF